MRREAYAGHRSSTRTTMLVGVLWIDYLTEQLGYIADIHEFQ